MNSNLDKDNSAVLLLGYGGPNALDEVPEFLKDIRGGRPTSPAFVDEITDRYRQIGGASPLYPITQRLALSLQERLGKPVYVGMRHWRPFIQDTLSRMESDGISHFNTLCLAPHYSYLSVGAYEKALQHGLSKFENPPSYQLLASWHRHPLFIRAWANNIQSILSSLDLHTTRILCTAHSLPARIIEENDPYVFQLTETMELIQKELNLSSEHFQLAYQSAALTGEPWLSPSVESLLPKLAREGIQQVVIAPIGFVAEHVEVLYDIDIAFQKIAKENQISLFRTSLLNDSPAMVELLVSLMSECNESTSTSRS